MHHDRVLARAIIASQFGPPFMFSGVAVALPSMGTDLHAGATALGLIETLFLAGSVAFLLPLGRLADSADKRSVYKLGLLAFGCVSMLTGSSSSLPVVLVLRFLQGVTSAALAVTGPAILTDIVPRESRGKAYGSSIGAIYAGLTLGPICAGALMSMASWRAVFFAGGGAVLLGLGLVHALLPSAWKKPDSPVHLPSAALIAGAVLFLVAGSATLRKPALGYSCLALAALLGTSFVIVQRRLATPLLDVAELVRNSELGRALLIQLLLYVNAFSSVFMLSIYMQVSLGHSPTRSGQVLAVGSVLMAAAAPFAGRLADRHSPRSLSACGVAVVLVSALMAASLRAESTLFFVAGVLAIQGLGFAFFSSPNMTIIMQSLPARAASTASALGAKARTLGMVLGMVACGILISLLLGDEPVQHQPARFITTMISSFYVLSAVNLLALVICLRQRPVLTRR